MEIRAERERLLTGEREKASRAEFITFQLGEIDRAELKPGEDEELEATRRVLGNADRVQRLCADAYDGLYEGDQAVLPALGTVWKRLGDLAALDERFVPYLDARTALKSQLEDLAFFLRDYSASTSTPRRRDCRRSRIALRNSNASKGSTGRPSTRSSPSANDSGGNSMTSSMRPKRPQNWTRRLRRRVSPIARRPPPHGQAGVGGGRLQPGAREIARRPGHEPHAVRGPIHPRARRVAVVRSRGRTGEFYISANPGEDVSRWRKSPPGGELSRIMLALKTLASTDAPGKTLIFDEVDAGIGGAVADVVGARLQRLAGRFQVLCITHLPQIAAYGATPLRIAKSVRAGRTITRVARSAGQSVKRNSRA